MEELSTTTDAPVKRAAIYIRVSTKQQAVRDGNPEGYSLPTQRDACTRKAEALGAVVIEEYVDKDTGTSVDKRPAMQRLLARMERDADLDYVIVCKLDRWARKTREDLVSDFILEVAHCALVSCSENIDRTAAGRLLHSMLASVNEYQSNNMSDDIKRKTLAKVQGGGTHGRAPIGYLNVQDGIDVRYVIIDELRAPLVQWAFGAYATGDWTTRQLAAELTRRGLRSRPGKKSPSREIKQSGLQHMLSNPYYKGVVIYRGVEYPSKHNPLVDPVTWQNVQAMLTAKNRSEKERSHHHYLKSTLFCGYCESRMIVSHNRGRAGVIYPYFVCSGRHEKTTTCELKAQRIDLVEALVLQHYMHVRLSAELLQRVHTALDEALRTRTELAKVEHERQQLRITQLENERTQLLRAHLNGAVPMDLLQAEQARLTEELVAAKSVLDRHAIEVQVVSDTLTRATELLTNCHAIYGALVPAGRRLMNQAFFKRLLVTEQGIVGWEFAEPFNALIGEDTQPYLWSLHRGEGSEKQSTYKRSRPKQLVARVRDLLVVEAMGLEPTTSCLQSTSEAFGGVRQRSRLGA